MSHRGTATGSAAQGAEASEDQQLLMSPQLNFPKHETFD